MIYSIIMWLSRSDENIYIGILAAGVAFLIVSYGIVLSRDRRQLMTPLGHLMNIVISPVIGSLLVIAHPPTVRLTRSA